eukprot:TRINITY_DN21643_c0_g2_i1.p1 TRINITY_DN21643_c0_g2~~TRINITY_DN21643_c0_g2_i1.p1  ORF type:complete len:889 (+),score=177.07 TRINITY_DN21643_c0_g2_i1:74-2740(+)
MRWFSGNDEGENDSCDEDDEREREVEALLSLPFTLVFFVVFTVTQWFHRDVAKTFPMTSNIKAIMELKIQASGDAPNVSTAWLGGADCIFGASLCGAEAAVSPYASTTMGLDSVTSLPDIINWIEVTPLRRLWETDEDGQRGDMLQFNQLIGGLRIRQRRSDTADCPGHAVLTDNLRLDCFGKDAVSAGTPTGKAVARDLQSFKADSSGDYTYWLDILQDEATALAHVAQLRILEWLSPGADKVDVEAVFYNSQVAFFTHVDVSFSVNTDGSLTKKLIVQSLPTLVYDSWGTILGDVCILILLVCRSLFEIYFLVFTARFGLESLKKYMTWFQVLNWVLVILGYGFSIFFIVLSSRLEKLAKAAVDVFEEVPDLDANSYQPGFSEDPWKQRHDALSTVFDEVAYLTQLLRLCELATFWYGLVVMMKFFKAFQGHPKLNILTETLRKACVDVAWFMVIFMLIFFSFILGAFFLFGHQLYEWSNISLSFNTGFQILMGDFDFGPMYAIAPLSSVVWFYSYMCLFFLVMLNMLLAIIMDTYSVVKDEAEKKAAETKVPKMDAGRARTLLRKSFTAVNLANKMSTRKSAEKVNEDWFADMESGDLKTELQSVKELSNGTNQTIGNNSLPSTRAEKMRSDRSRQNSICSSRRGSASHGAVDHGLMKLATDLQDEVRQLVQRLAEDRPKDQSHAKERRGSDAASISNPRRFSTGPVPSRPSTAPEPRSTGSLGETSALAARKAKPSEFQSLFGETVRQRQRQSQVQQQQRKSQQEPVPSGPFDVPIFEEDYHSSRSSSATGSRRSRKQVYFPPVTRSMSNSPPRRSLATSGAFQAEVDMSKRYYGCTAAERLEMISKAMLRDESKNWEVQMYQDHATQKTSQSPSKLAWGQGGH